MRGVALLLVAGACGRIGFDAPGDGVQLTGHDEDGDGIPDAFDVCPWVADLGQDDRDGDQVGDACDPQPDVAAERIALFCAMTADDPVVPVVTDTGVWMHLGDAWRSPGIMFSALRFLTTTVGNATIEVGFDVVQHTMQRRQVGIAISPGSGPYYYAEIYDDTNPLVGITHYDGTGFVLLDNSLFPRADFAGSGRLRLSVDLTAATYTAAGQLAGNEYVVNTATPGNAPAPFRVTVQYSIVDIRYIAVVETTP